MIAAVNQTVTLVTIIVGSLLGCAGLATFLYGLRWKSNWEVERASSASLRDGRDEYKLRTERLDGDLRACKEALATLEATRSLEPVLRAILDGFLHMEGQVVRHEERAQQRHETNQQQGVAHLRILEMIADRVGPEPNGTHEPT